MISFMCTFSLVHVQLHLTVGEEYVGITYSSLFSPVESGSHPPDPNPPPLGPESSQLQLHKKATR